MGAGVTLGSVFVFELVCAYGRLMVFGYKNGLNHYCTQVETTTRKQYNGQMKPLFYAEIETEIRAVSTDNDTVIEELKASWQREANRTGQPMCSQCGCTDILQREP